MEEYTVVINEDDSVTVCNIETGKSITRDRYIVTKDSRRRIIYIMVYGDGNDFIFRGHLLDNGNYAQSFKTKSTWEGLE